MIGDIYRKLALQNIDTVITGSKLTYAFDDIRLTLQDYPTNTIIRLADPKIYPSCFPIFRADKADEPYCIFFKMISAITGVDKEFPKPADPLRDYYLMRNRINFFRVIYAIRYNRPKVILLDLQNNIHYLTCVESEICENIPIDHFWKHAFKLATKEARLVDVLEEKSTVLKARLAIITELARKYFPESVIRKNVRSLHRNISAAQSLL